MKKQKFQVTKKGGIIQTTTSPNGAAKRQLLKEGAVIEASSSDAQIRGLLRLRYLQEYAPQKPTPKPATPVIPKKKKDAETKPLISNTDSKDKP